MAVLFPPVLENQGVAFLEKPTISSTDVVEVYFNMPVMVDVSQIGHVQVSLRHANTGAPAVNSEFSPDGVTLFFPSDKNSGYFMPANEEKTLYVIKIPYEMFAFGRPKGDTMYLIQVRFGNAALWNGWNDPTDKFKNFAQWRQTQTTSVPSGFGEWSNQQKKYCRSPAIYGIDYNFSDFVPTIVWNYSGNKNDPISQVIMNYEYEGVHGKIRKSEVFDGEFLNDGSGLSGYIFKHSLNVAPVVLIRVTIDAVTKNNSHYGSSISIPPLGAGFGDIPLVPNPLELKDAEISTIEREDGILAKRCVHPSKTLTKGIVYNVFRINTMTLDCVKIIKDRKYDEGEVVDFKDYTVEMGEDYQYVFVQYEQGAASKLLTPLYPFGPKNPCYGRLMRMDSTFLTSRYHQLRLSGNVTLSGLKNNVADNFQTTIGSKFPFYTRASQTKYRTFTLKGLVSINFDPTSSFLALDNLGPIEEGNSIDPEVFKALENISPGVTTNEYFTPGQRTSAGLFIPCNKEAATEFRLDFGGKTLSQEEKNNRTLLVNRCLTSITLNGLWWKDANESRLLIADRDIIESSEISLSRRRVTQGDSQKNYNNRNEKIVELGQEEHHSLLKAKGEDTSQREYYDYPERKNSQIPGPETIYGDYYYRQSGLNYSTGLTDEIIFVERKFREKVMDWLTDGKPKLFRSETEGNMIVMTSQVTFDPFNKSRSVYNVSMTLTEIADLTAENLIDYDLLPIEIRSYYPKIDLLEYIWGKVDTGIDRTFQLIYDPSMDIPNMLVHTDMIFRTNILKFIVNGSGDYTFSTPSFDKGGLPPGFKISNGGEIPRGTIYGAPTSEAKNKSVAIISVKDNKTGAVSSVKIQVGYAYTRLVYPSDHMPYQPTVEPGHGSTSPIGVIGQEILPTPPLQDYTDSEGIIHKHDPVYFVSGGIPPYSFLGNNMLPGIRVNSKSGIITGVYNTPAQEADKDKSDMYIIVSDQAKQTLKIKVAYHEIAKGLNFEYSPSFAFGYAEKTKPLLKVDITSGPSGGTGKYTYTLLVDDLPKQGWNYTGSAVDGYIFENGFTFKDGIFNADNPIAAAVLPGCKIRVKIEDEAKQSVIAELPFSGMLDILKITRPPDAADTFDIFPDGRIEIGHNGIVRDLAQFASGGLRKPGENPYEWYARNLGKNFSLYQNGTVIGGGVAPANAIKNAEVYIKDARGVTSQPVPIYIGEVSAGMVTDIDHYEIHELYEGDQVTPNVYKYYKQKEDENGVLQPSEPPVKSATFNIRNKRDLGFERGDKTVSSFDEVNQDGGTPDFNSHVTAKLVENRKGDVTLTETKLGEEWQLSGVSTGAKNGKTALLTIQEQDQNSYNQGDKTVIKELQIPVVINPSYSELTWSKDTHTQNITVPLDSPFSVRLVGISGGRPPYKATIASSMIGSDGNDLGQLFTDQKDCPSKIEVMQNPQDPSTLVLTGFIDRDQFKAMADGESPTISYKISYPVKITITDSKDPEKPFEGTSVSNQHSINIIVAPDKLVLNVEKRFHGQFYLRNLSTMKSVKVFSATGGKPPYKFYFNTKHDPTAANEHIPGGFILSTEGELSGKATEVTQGVDVSSKVWVKDSLGTIASCQNIWAPPVVVVPPVFGDYAQTNGDTAFDSGTYLVPDLVPQQYFRIDRLFLNLTYPSIRILHDELPEGLDLKIFEGTLTMYGVPPSIVKNRTGRIQVEFSGPPGSKLTNENGDELDMDTYTAAGGPPRAVKTLNLKFQGDYEPLRLVGSNSIIIRKGVEDANLDVIDLSKKFRGGVGPFSWKICNLGSSGPDAADASSDFGDCGLNLHFLDDINRNAYIGGSYGPTITEKGFDIYCIDYDGTTIKFTLSYQGAAEKMIAKANTIIEIERLNHGGTKQFSLDLKKVLEKESMYDPNYSYYLDDTSGILHSIFPDNSMYTFSDSKLEFLGNVTNEARSAQTGIVTVWQLSNGEKIQEVPISISSGGVIGRLSFDRRAAIRHGRKIEFKLPLPAKQAILDLDLQDGPAGGVPPYTFTAPEGYNPSWEITCESNGKISSASCSKDLINEGSFYLLLTDSSEEKESIRVQVFGVK